MATARVARPPPGLAFREGAGPGDAPVVTFEAKRAFDAFADSLTAETMNRAARPYDVTASAGSGTARGASGKGHDQPPVRVDRALVTHRRGAREVPGAVERASRGVFLFGIKHRKRGLVEFADHALARVELAVPRAH